MAIQIDVRKLPQASPAAIAAIKRALGIAPRMRTGPLAAAAKVVLAKAKPGKERWPVKTGTDDDVSKVKPQIVPATVEELVRAARPAGMKDPAKFNKAFQSKRGAPVETTIWQVEARIIGIKAEDDGDLHVILQGASGEMLVAEVPTPGPPFVGASSPFNENIRQARAALEKKFLKTAGGQRFLPMGNVMMPVEAFSQAPGGARPMAFPAGALALPAGKFKSQVKPTKVRITGVGFFDRTHGQTGGAPNGIELHPILSVKFL